MEGGRKEGGKDKTKEEKNKTEERKDDACGAVSPIVCVVLYY